MEHTHSAPPDPTALPVDHEVLAQTQSVVIGQAAIRNVQLEAMILQHRSERQRLVTELAVVTAKLDAAMAVIDDLAPKEPEED